MILDTLNAVIEPLFNIVESNINVAAPTGILLLGLVTGWRHSIEADHVAAVLSVVASNRKNIKGASMLGAIWGLWSYHIAFCCRTRGIATCSQHQRYHKQ